jgi:RNA polymerase-binding transcription factor DksA
MKASEILRKLADVIDSQETAAVNAGNHNRNALEPVDVDTQDHTEQTVMITPLQQKQELLKKAAGVESFYDNEHGDCEQCGSDPCACGHDPLDVLKQNAGLSVIIQDIGGEENDIY